MGPAAILAFAVSVAYWPGLISAAVAPRWVILAAAIPLLFWLDPRRLTAGSWMLLMGLIAIAMVTLWYCPDRILGINDLIHLLIFAAAVFAGSALVSIDGAYTGAAIGLCVSAAIAIPQTFGWTLIGQAYAPAGLFFNRDVLAESTALVLIWAALSRRWFLAVPLMIPLALCGSRVAVCTAVVGLIVGAPKKLRFYGMTLSVAAVGIFVFSMQAGKIRSVTNRLELWQSALSDIRLFGHGIGAYTIEHRSWEYAHSDLLQAVYELGIIGAAILVAIFVFSWVNGRGDPVARAVLAGAVVQVLVAFPLHLPLQTFLVGILAGSMARRRDLVCGTRSRGGDSLGAAYRAAIASWRTLGTRPRSGAHVPV